MALFIFPAGLKAIQDKAIDLGTGGDNIGIMLMDNSYTPSAAHEDVADISANELSATNYARKNLANQSTAVVGNNAVFDADDVSWDPGIVSGTAGGHVVYYNSGVDGTSTLLFYDDTPASYPITFANTVFEIFWSANGIFRFLGG